MNAKILIRRIPVGKINPAPYNPRRDLRPQDREYRQLQKSLGEFGYVDPLVWNRRSGNLVGGHQRFKLLLAAGAREIDVSVVDLSPEREKALNLALNRIRGEWDRDKLAGLLDELVKSPELDLSVTGFEPAEARELIGDVLGGAGGGREAFDASRELELQRARGGRPVTRPGDLILLGGDRATQHRLVCGDCTDPAQVRRLMDGQRAVLCATDPPYLVGYDGTGRPKAKRRSAAAAAAPRWDDPAGQPDLWDRCYAAALAEALGPQALHYCWYASRRHAELEAVWAKHGIRVHQQIIWAKDRGIPGYGHYMWAHEPCLMGWREGQRPRRRTKALGGREPVLTTVWHAESPAGEDRPGHLTPKPLELFEIPIRQHTAPGEVCYEPFCGSGTQVLAAQRLGRRCFALEINPLFCDLIVRRFLAFVGESAADPGLVKRYRRPGKGAAA